ncbi:MAG: hypothetical protein ACRD3N_12995 [Terracidiphilus sp.]
MPEPVERAPNTSFNPGTDLERGRVREQLARILSSSAFQHSTRYASVLKFIIDSTLEGSGDRLKERTIGIEVFDRRPDYDTATDHVVRSAVAEVRKRLAQYYVQSAQGELRIEIPHGSYIPQFHWPEESARIAPAPVRAAAVLPHPVSQPASAAPAGRAMPIPVWTIAVSVVLVAAIAVVVATTASSADPLNGFWGPVLSSRAPILLCIGNVEDGVEPPADNPDLNPRLTLREFHNAASSTVNEHDAFTLAKLAGLLEARGKRVLFESQSDATFAEMQNGPTILIGLLNNNWTERLMPKLRFTVERPTADKVVIRDRENPTNDAWSIDYSAPYLSISKDYALVLRMVDPQTEQTVVVAAGITVFGTSAAGNFLTNENEIAKLVAVAPHGWEKKNMEIVLSTDVIGGQSGPASIVATQFW